GRGASWDGRGASEDASDDASGDDLDRRPAVASEGDRRAAVTGEAHLGHPERLSEPHPLGYRRRGAALEARRAIDHLPGGGGPARPVSPQRRAHGGGTRKRPAPLA